VTFDKPGSHYATVRLGADTLTFDNQLSAGIDVRERLNVLVLATLTRPASSIPPGISLTWRLPRRSSRTRRPIRYLPPGPLLFTLCQDQEPTARLADGRRRRLSRWQPRVHSGPRLLPFVCLLREDLVAVCGPEPGVRTPLFLISVGRRADPFGQE